MKTAHLLKLLLLGALPLASTSVGAFIDERGHLGFTNWRSACRAAGFSPGAVMNFSLELLPTAIVGLLAGGLALLAIGIALRRHDEEARLCFAAHAGCAATMPVGMAFCALALPLYSMVLADVLLALAGATVVYSLVARRTAAAPTIHT
jgi:hypothetical protein